jgi:hypothetical protein
VNRKRNNRTENEAMSLRDIAIFSIMIWKLFIVRATLKNLNNLMALKPDMDPF